MEDLPDLADRFRGALGRALERLSPQTDDAWQLLFGSQLPLVNGAIVRPYAIRAHREKGQIICLVRLFGFADCWTDEVSHALVEAAQTGIALRMHGMHRVPLPVLSVKRALSYWQEPKTTARVIDVRFATPLIIRHKARVSGVLDSLYVACVRRVAGIARWCDVAPDTALQKVMMEQAWRTEDVDLHPVGWTRHSSTHPQGRATTGLIGRARISKLNATNISILRASEIFHAGGGATSGNGEMIASF
ncbi:hypothetical protein [Oryzibacter oryziterrae]|uniref:hypothetical protein n=1 Tax=Oryzibacter oryziterrae TaxID=2766474 RepID=UPI001F3102DE|nr:hypothetical protein [Oryzibacter oryziterrae]